MAETPDTTPKHRPTLADQNARYYELLMAQATKSARQGSQSVEWGERTTGPTNGHLYFKKIDLVQREDESDVQFIGRQEEVIRLHLALRETLNAEADKQAVGAAKETK